MARSRLYLYLLGFPSPGNNMRTLLRLSALLVLSIAVSEALADSSIRLTTFPSFLAAADGHSTVSVKAEIRDQNGRNVQDGTRVVFSTDLGTFRENVVATSGGTAFATLIAPTTSGIANITAQAVSVGAAPATAMMEFTTNRDLLNSAKQYIEIVAPGYMQYAYNQSAAETYQVIAAAGPNGGVRLKYLDISLTADDMQLNLQNMEFRGRRVRLRMGGVLRVYDELNLRLDRKEGFGTTSYAGKRTNQVVTQGRGIAFVEQDATGKLSIPADETRYGLVAVRRQGIVPMPGQNLASVFVFRSLAHAPSSISARKAIIFPKRKIQFQAAKIYVAGQRVLDAPLFEYNLITATPLVTEQMLGVVNSQLQANYPYFLSLSPEESSLMRLRTGSQYGRTDTPDSGVFLDYELDWNKGDDMQGSFVYSGIGRNDWTAGLNEFYRLDDRTSTSVQLFTPTGESYYGSASANHQFNGFSVGVSGDESRSVSGIPFTATDYSATIAKDPIKMGSSPFRLYLEVTDTGSYNQLINQTQAGVGTRAKVQSTPIPIDKSTTWTGSATTSYLVGENELHGLQYLASLSINHRFSNAFNSSLTYNFTRDGFNEYVIGEHELVLQNSYNTGNASLNIMANKALDIDRSTVFGDLGYKFSRLWRISTGYTYDTYLGTTFIDYNFGFTYLVGWRQVGLIWSEQTRKIGLQILGSTGF